MRIFRNTIDLPKFKNAVVTIGSFDGIHLGHRKILNRINTLAHEINGESVVLTFNPHPRKVLFPKEKDLSLLQTLDEKLEMMRSLGIDNTVVIPFTVEFSQMHPREYIEKFLIKNFTPKYIVIGYDHRFGLNRSGDIYFLKQYEEQYGYKVIEISPQEIEENVVSSTNIRRALNEGDVELANSFLKSNYIISGTVIHGDKIGKQLGFPTANIKLNDINKLVPKEGVYCVRVFEAEKYYGGMLYIGSRPTLNGEAKVIEVNIFDFEQDIYGDNLIVELISYVRGDIKFSNLDELKQQLALDKDASLKELERSYVGETNKDLNCTIAILNYNGVDYLESNLPSITHSSANNFETLIIDNNSNDESIELVKDWYPEINIIEFTDNYGFAKGYAKALKKVDTKYTVILNSDVQVEEGWLDPLIEALEKDKELAAVQPKIKSLEDKNSFEYAGAAGGFLDKLAYPFCRGRVFDEIETDEHQYDDEINVSWVSGAAMVIRTKLFNKLGGFDESYFAHFEEIDLSIRLQRAGYQLKVIPTSVVYHLGGGTMTYQSNYKLYLNFRNSLITIIKNFSLAKLVWMVPARLVLDGVAGAKFLVEGDKGFLKTWNIVKAHVYVYLHIFQILKRRRFETRSINENRINYPGKILMKNYSIVWKHFVKKISRYRDLK
jgi:hypothetical protein